MIISKYACTSYILHREIGALAICDGMYDGWWERTTVAKVATATEGVNGRGKSSATTCD